MRKDISPDMYNYNKFPGPQFITFDNHVKSDEIDLLILENVKNAFNAKVFSQRFSEILLKYDYIVGDWGNEQLRLKGFYKEDSKAKNRHPYIGRLDDYLKEYCNFGCAYFVLENPNPKEVKAEEDNSQRRRRRDNRKKKRFNKNTKMNPDRIRQEKTQECEALREIHDAKKNFVIRKKEK
ncbi:YutD family protein [Streptococcus caviae]|uniref:YutD family protein n=1 Tax=Streptococcus sp. 'caviae' TaxID=1915004 RepID=UPI00094BB5CF|nr:YutD-like domain-containing protein [Streptococcus sp. 'caviae']OLN84017.1 transcriptional regulator [Streptococcus sp. 'caviae']